jgi:hypothetical protein
VPVSLTQSADYLFTNSRRCAKRGDKENGTAVPYIGVYELDIRMHTFCISLQGKAAKWAEVSFLQLKMLRYYLTAPHKKHRNPLPKPTGMFGFCSHAGLPGTEHNLAS